MPEDAPAAASSLYDVKKKKKGGLMSRRKKKARTTGDAKQAEVVSGAFLRMQRDLLEVEWTANTKLETKNDIQYQQPCSNLPPNRTLPGAA
jgi:hypothetical protein